MLVQKEIAHGNVGVSNSHIAIPTSPWTMLFMSIAQNLILNQKEVKMKR